MRLLLFLTLFPLSAFANTEPADTPAKGPFCSSPKWGEVVCIREPSFAEDTCRAIETLAKRHGLDVGFFARLIWQESRFDANAVSHAGAMGIAQFMDFTAERRGLRDAFNPAEALDHSAEYLAEMANKFGNLGFAAMGYNAGEHRVQGLLDGGNWLPRETINYVKIITGLGYKDWMKTEIKAPDLRLSKDQPFQASCMEMAAKRKISPPQKLIARAVPYVVPPTGEAAEKPAETTQATAAILSALAPSLSPYPKERPAHRTAPWGVQLAFGKNQKEAMSRYRQLTKSCQGKLRGERPDLINIQNKVSGKRGFIMVRVGRPTLMDARRLCQKLASSGCSCRVYRNDI